MLKNCLIILFRVVFLLFFSCARQIGPGGGPDDKTPPAVLAATPPIGTVSHPINDPISFMFSEWVDGKNAEKCVSIFPPPQEGIKIKVHGKTMIIKPVKAFSESTTYHIELSTSFNDLHGNSIGTPYHFFFSTGKTIDSGKAFGCIVFPERSTSQPKISLFAENKGDFSDTCYFNLPSYVVQTDSFGAFSFEHVRKGSYRIIGFIDANSDNRLEPGIEQAFAAIDRSITLDSIVGPLSLFPVACDTMTNRIVSLKPLTDRVLIGAWTHPNDNIPAEAVAKWRILRLDSARSVSAPPAIKEYLPIASTVRFMIKLSDTMTMAPYLLSYSVAMPLTRRDQTWSHDSIRFNGTHQRDTTRPIAQVFSPTAAADLKPRLKLVWSKPVIPAASAWIMIDSLKDTVKLAITRELSDSTIFKVQRALKPDRLYRLQMPETLFTDITGNHPHDTAFGKFSIRTISAENMCNSLTGGASCLSKNTQRKWLFLPIGASAVYVSKDSCGTFRFDSLPAGKGRIASFFDFNGDTTPTPGALFPWRKPEPYRLYPDTIEARARWDIEGIEIQACKECTQKKSIPSGATSILNKQLEKNVPKPEAK